MSSFNTDPDYEECIVTFIDLLGFRDLLNRRTAADIRQILNTFRREAEPYDPGLPSDPSRRGITSEVKMEVGLRCSRTRADDSLPLPGWSIVSRTHGTAFHPGSLRPPRHLATGRAYNRLRPRRRRT